MTGDLTDFLMKCKDVKPHPDAEKMVSSATWRDLKRLNRLGVFPRHRGIKIGECSNTPKRQP